MASGIDGKGKYTWNIRIAQMQSAEARRCPKCNRKSALKRDVDKVAGLIEYTCRWCDYYRIIG